MNWFAVMFVGVSRKAIANDLRTKWRLLLSLLVSQVQLLKFPRFTGLPGHAGSLLIGLAHVVVEAKRGAGLAIIHFHFWMC